MAYLSRVSQNARVTYVIPYISAMSSTLRSVRKEYGRGDQRSISDTRWIEDHPKDVKRAIESSEGAEVRRGKLKGHSTYSNLGLFSTVPNSYFLLHLGLPSRAKVKDQSEVNRLNSETEAVPDV